LKCIVGTRLKLIPLKPELPPIPVGAVWRKDDETEPVRAFIAAALAKPTKNDRPPAA
jgi:DNA-binding transcriptional LysR family regulator